MKFQATLPKRVREKFNFKEGDILVFAEEKWQINHLKAQEY
ncbi:AbrB/MazE/SpoVT family DNA-binding domain-containing protein [Caldisericum sp.]